MGEVGELAELYQWRDKEAELQADPASQLHQRSAEELADVLLYLIRLADVLGIDPVSAANRKLDVAEERFPVDQYLGQAPDKT